MTETLRGDADMYTRPVLAIYDPIALGMVCPIAWKCSRGTMLKFYQSNIGARHLDIGPGTGYFLDKVTYPVTHPKIVIADLNETVLDTVAKRIARFRPESLVRDALQPLELGNRSFTTAALLNVIHCLPGTMEQKAAVFDHVLPYVEPGGRIFGSTVLGKGVKRSKFGEWLFTSYNKAGSFRNTEDSMDLLEAELAKRFDSYRTHTVGSMGFFEIDVP
ncbi:class I SAM-dependent methyltransferase [Kibdelosporangium philippinense]|uniref:Class I SAM-dependent methyltransferase n=1 Tax=Kibdelosporangium philippinense TaxID=211113 RepID=A0ABS8Z3A0_9PSEU|nr:class I SAM-dependent methyltransferase [Kibdelosporangium philippinense]MCE7002315.1 class I SAM-dependent methyltransferase [Kibdelosporangium philippinense]